MKEIADLIVQVAQVYRGCGHERSAELADKVLECVDVPGRVEPNTAVALNGLPQAADLGGALPIARTIAELSNALDWRTSRAMQFLDLTRDRHAYVELGGPDGMFHCDDIRVGVYFQSADTVYPIHFHQAEEFYLVVAGTADWQKDDASFAPQPPGTLIHHLPMQHHATTTTGEPLLALWIWSGDISPDSYQVLDVPGL